MTRACAPHPTVDSCHEIGTILAPSRLTPIPGTRSGAPKYPIEHPAPADVDAVRAAAVRQHLLVVAPGVLERVREDRHRAELARLVHLSRQCSRRLGPPPGVELDRAERV